MDSLEIPTHRKLCNNHSDSLAVVGTEKGSGLKRHKSVVSRVSSAPGDSGKYYYLQAGTSGNLRRAQSCRRSYRNKPSGFAVTATDNNGVIFSTPGMAEAEMLLLQSTTNKDLLEVVDPSAVCAGTSITSIKISDSPTLVVSSPTGRQSFRAKSRQSSAHRRPYGQRRQSAWTGEQMRGDFAEIIHKIVDHPQSIVSFSVIFVAVGVLLIVVALSANSKVMNYIGVGFIVIGVAVFVLGAAWFYTHSKARQARLNDRANLRLISLQALEEEGVKSSREGSMKGSIKGSIRGSIKEKHHSSHCNLKEIDENDKQTTG